MTALLTEAVLGIVFHYKDRNLEPMAVHDYPYLYFMFDTSTGLNEHGFKTNYSIKKQPGKYRIILTGGSVARGKLPDESIAHYLERELNTRFNTDKIEVINAGVSAFVAEQVFLNIQLILQHYEPDMMVSLDGYNDLMTFKLNRPYPSSFELPPHHWQDFQVIAENKKKNEALARFPLFFRNISRVIRFVGRKQFEKKYDWSSLTVEMLAPRSRAYWQIISDTRDFCKAKNIHYYSFLQPVKFYDRNAAQADAELKALSMLYRLLEDDTREKRYSFSLTSVFNQRKDIFTDDCHVTAEGNQIMAKEMADRIVGDVQAWMEN